MDRNSNIYKTYSLARYEESFVGNDILDFAREEPLLIRVGDKPYSVVMRTPGDEIAHAAGFCLSEGLVDSYKDIASIGFCSDLDENSVMVKLSNERQPLVLERLDRGGFLSQTSCGICGREMVSDLIQNLKVVNKESGISYRQVFECFEKFFQNQEYYLRTRGTHAVMLFDSDLNIISKAEDVGRHNSMDKAIGALLLRNRVSDVFLAALSSRISFEMIQKAARAEIPILISKSNPTSMAVEMGLKLNMTLICLDKNAGFIVPCGAQRVMSKGGDLDSEI